MLLVTDTFISPIPLDDGNDYKQKSDWNGYREVWNYNKVFEISNVSVTFENSLKWSIHYAGDFIYVSSRSKYDSKFLLTSQSCWKSL